MLAEYQQAVREDKGPIAIAITRRRRRTAAIGQWKSSLRMRTKAPKWLFNVTAPMLETSAECW